MRKQLTRHGLPISAGGLAVALGTCGQAAPAITAELVRTTVGNAHIFLFGTAAAKAALGTHITSLADGVLHAMILSRWKVAVSLVALLAFTLFGGTFATGLTSVAFAGTFLHDDFEDGSTTDGMPVTWALDPQFNGGTHSVQNGSYVLTPDSINDYPNDNASEIDVFPEGQTFGQVSLRSVVRLLGPQNDFWVGLAGRITSDADKQNTAIWGALRPSGQLMVGAFNVKENMRTTWLGSYGPAAPSLQAQDVNLQLDLFADSAALTAWVVGTQRPASPQIFIPNLPDFLPSEGRIGMWTAQRLANPVAPVAFRYFEAVPVPEPATASIVTAGGAMLATGVFVGRRRLNLHK
jgi:hypothetical protein